MRISVSNWSTTTNDVERSLTAMVRIARECCRRSLTPSELIFLRPEVGE